MFDGIVIFLCVKKDKTAVQCSADVLVSLSKYVARWGRRGRPQTKTTEISLSHLDLPLLSMIGPLLYSASSDDTSCVELIFTVYAYVIDA